jgi:hypothetical protein
MAQRTLPPIVNWTQFFASDIPAPPELVKGLIHQGTKTALGGGSKSMKTWTQMDLALSVAYGLPFLGHSTKQGQVLIVNLEVQDWACLARLKAISHAKKIVTNCSQSPLDVWNLRGYAASHETIIPTIRERIQKNYALVIIDPIYKIYGNLDENKAGDITLLMNNVEDLAVQSGSAVVFAAHFSKGNQGAKESIDRISGSGVFARDPDSLLIFTKHEEPDCFTVEPTIRNMPPVEPFVVRWQYPLMVVDDMLDPTKLKKGGRPKRYTETMIFDCMPEIPTEPAALYELVSIKYSMSKSTFYDLLEKLENHPKAGKNKEGLWCRQS